MIYKNEYAGTIKIKLALVNKRGKPRLIDKGTVLLDFDRQTITSATSPLADTLEVTDYIGAAVALSLEGV